MTPLLPGTLADVLPGGALPSLAAASALAAGLLVGRVVFLAGRNVLRRRWTYADQPPPVPQKPPGSTRVRRYEGVEKRRSGRRLGQPVKVLLVDHPAENSVLEGWVLDRSMTGLCLALPRSLPAKTLLQVRATNAPEGTPWVEAEVVHSQATADYCRVGCRYLAAPRIGVLLLFG